MFVGFFQELKAAGLPVTLREYRAEVRVLQ